MLPLKDNVPTRAFPVVTVALIAANVIVWFWEVQTGVEHDVLHYGYYPCSVEGPCVQPASVLPHVLPWYEGIFSSMFMHGSWVHIGGNMLFLWIFGNNVEDKLGEIKFLVIYLAAGIAGSLLQVYITPTSTVPMLGASGAISGILAAYVLYFPRARVLTFIVPFFFITISAYLVIGYWIGLQLFDAFLGLGVTGGGVAYFAHIGGFTSGLILAVLLRPREHPDPHPDFPGYV
jgi:membrane associated rhomboid family serine protease